MYIILKGSVYASHYVTDVENLQAGGGVMLQRLSCCSCGNDITGWNGLCLIIVTCLIWGHWMTAHGLFTDALSGLPAATYWYSPYNTDCIH
jgi:hypothetical protein